MTYDADDASVDNEFDETVAAAVAGCLMMLTCCSQQSTETAVQQHRGNSLWLAGSSTA